MASAFSHHDIAVWIESNNDTSMRVCVKSLRAGVNREEVYYFVFVSSHGSVLGLTGSNFNVKCGIITFFCLVEHFN